MSWQPIATAPHDRKILVYCPDLGIACGRWEDDRYAVRPRPYWRTDKESIYGVRHQRLDQPTHWMPLPEPPR